MKRTALLRRTPLRAKATIARGTPTRRKAPKRSNAERDEDYLNFIRGQPCMVEGCTEPSEAHHIENDGLSLKCSDYRTVPLCGHHHRGCWHGRPGLPGASRATWLARFAAKADELFQAYFGSF